MNRLELLPVLALLALLALATGLSAAPEEPAATAEPAAAVEPAPAAPAAGDVPLVSEEVRRLMQDRDYAAAIEAIDRAAAAEGAPVDYLTYLKGRAHYLTKQYDEAAAVFEGLAKTRPEGPWARRARFGKALALARQGDFRGAELIFRAEAEYLLSPARRQQIADIYLEFADRYFDPPKDDLGKPEFPPDYEKALKFYGQALEVGPKPEKRADVELLVARCRQKLNQLDQAAGLYEKFIEEHADSPLLVEARFLLGECRMAQGDPKAARRAWEDLLAAHGESDSERVAETQYRLARTWGIPTPGSEEDLNLGTAALTKFLEGFPEHELAAKAHLEIARSFLHRGRHEDAAAALKGFLADPRYQDREEVPEARNLLGSVYRAQGKFDEALAVWRDYLAKHPAHEQWSDVQRHIVDTQYMKAEARVDEEQYDAANELFAEFLARYPLDPRNPNILLLMNRKFQHEEKWDEAMANWRRIVSKYPGTSEASLAQYSIAHTLETKLGKVEKALEEYRKVTWGASQSDARQAAARLTATSMQVATERIFRSDETPRLMLTTRNVEKVSVRVYRVDLETYFRKMHLARGLEGLDIALIDPDVTFDFEVPEYRKYQKLESDLEVPLPEKADSGVVAVTVSSKTLEATTMLLQSDLDVIVKSSRDEAFVFAENMRTGKPWPGVRLLISNGRKVFAEGTTGEDGVFRLGYSDIPSPQPSPEGRGGLEADDVRVFAVTGGHTASNLVGLSGVGVAEGLADKGYVYTDRPAYRAGQLVHIRGCIRRVPGGAERIGLLPPAQPPPQPATDNADPFGGAQPEEPNPAGGDDPFSGGGEAMPADPFGDGGEDPFAEDPAAPDGPGPGPEARRPAPGDVYLVEAGKPYTVEVFDNRQRLVYEEEVELGRFGTFHVHFLLPPTSPQGPYRVVARDLEGKTFQGTFQVHEYQLEPVRLVIDTPRKIYYRGEEIEGTIRAEYYYGAPLADREIRYQLAGERTYTATTDAAGEVKFKLPTRDFSESRTLPLVVTLPQRNLTQTANFVLATQGFSIGVKSPRGVYVAGQSFEVEATTQDAEHQPVSRELTLKVLKQTTEPRPQQNGGFPGGGFFSVPSGGSRAVGERLVEEHALKTGDDGVGRVTLKLDEGGRYVLRVEGTDRFDNPISGSTSVTISDDKDDVRLRIFAERHTFQVGDTGTVNLHWREEPALALVTFEGARVLDYRLVTLKKGDNELAIPMTAELAPNFELGVAVMQDSLSLRERAGVRVDAASGRNQSSMGPRPVRGGRNTGQGAHAMTAELAPNFELGVAVMQDSLSLGERAGVRVDAASGRNQSSMGPRPVRGGRNTGQGAHATELRPSRAHVAAQDPNPLPEGEGTVRKRFHTAANSFTVERELLVAIEAARADGGKGPVRPGERVQVTVSTTDPQGKPVAAELSLAMVEQSLLDRFAWPLPAIDDYFRGGRRASAMRTTSSITFEYKPDTRPINPRLLAEEERIELQRAETESRLEALTQLNADRTRRLEQARSVPERHELTAAARESRTADPFGAPDSGYYHQLDSAEAWGIRGDEQIETEEMQAYSATGSARGMGFGGGGMVRRYGGSVASRSSQAAAVVADFDTNGNGAWSFRHPTAEDLSVTGWQGMVVLSDGTVANVDRDELFSYFVGDDHADADAEQLAAEMAKAGAYLLPARAQQETGYWNPAVVTGDDGRATVEFTVPDRSTAWKLLAKGITTDTLAGETDAELVVKKPLFGELKLPLAFTDGDEAQVIASVHNDLLEAGKIDVTLKTTIAGRSVEETRTIEVKQKGIQELTFDVKLDRPAPADEAATAEAAADPRLDAAFELTVSAEAKNAPGGVAEVVRRSVPLKPYGMPVYATASGSASGDTTAWIEPPADVPLESPSLQILVGPSVERSLLDVVLGPAPWCQAEAGRFSSGLETATSDLMAALSLQGLLAATQQAAGPEAAALDARVRSGLSLLISAQNDDGGFSWTGQGGQSEPLGSARAVWALSMARESGYRVPPSAWDSARGYLRNQLTAAAATDYELKAILLHVLSTAGQRDFALANRLYRNRQSLSATALAYLALSFAEMDRDTTAKELLDLLLGQGLDAAAPESDNGPLPWSHSPVELRALVAIGLEKAAPADARLRELTDWLMAHRTGHRWAPDKATGPAAVSLCRWFATTRFEGERYALAVFVGDVEAARLDVDPAAGTQTIDVPQKLVKPERQRINFQLTGRGRYTYQCILGGFVPAEKLKSTATAWRVERRYEPAPLEVDGKPIGRGFGPVDGSYTEFHNPLTQLPVGRRGMVELRVYRTRRAQLPPEQLEYLVVTEPIPSGATVIEKSIAGPLDRYEIGPGAITFYVGNRRGVGTIRYELFGYLPGEYRAGPTVVRDAHRLEHIAVAEPKSLDVLPEGAKSKDKYRLTPQELYELGQHYFEKQQWDKAAEHLSKLLDEWKLDERPYKHSVEMLLDAHLGTGEPGEIVRYFEIIKERWPTAEIPFEKILKVGAAYHELGEYERSYLVFRATVESSFRRESRVAGFLEGQGEFLRSVDVMGRLLREYPPEGYLAEATYALAQRVYAKAPEAAGDPKLREQKVNRVDLIQRAWRMLASFLTAYPEDPAADQGAFAAANALLELDAYDRAAAACDRYAERYPESKLLDSFWYIIGYCRFASGEHEAAMQMCRKVAETRRVDPDSGREEPSPNKDRAIYILGQIHHSLGQAAEAIAQYGKVAEQFVDAAQSIAYFTRKAIELPEVTTVEPQKPVEVELKFRNIARCDVKVYRIDLMKFSLLKRNLQGITRINLAGIRPNHEETIELGDGRDYRDRTEKLALPLEEEGAYLVVCRGDNLHASGLVLVTPLKVEVQEDAVSGRVRATLKDRATEKYLSGVHVKVIGSGNQEFVSGETDLRGVFIADGIEGTTTVIAQSKEGQYAFYRGTAETGRARRYAPLDLSSRGESHKGIEKALDSLTHLEFIETPLQDVVDYLKDLHDIEIQIDKRALSDVGIGTDAAITKNLKDVSLRSALRLMLRELDLTAVVQDEVLLITTPEEAESRLTTKVYPVADLVRAIDSSGHEWHDFDSLIDMISSTVEPQTWDDVGGPGSIAPFETNLSLVVSQTQEVHRDIEALLTRLRSIPTPEGGPPVRDPGGSGGFGGFGGMGGGMGGGFGKPSMKAQLLEGLQQYNRDFQTEQSGKLQQMYDAAPAAGVEAQEAF